jgi:hypothetical protein
MLIETMSDEEVYKEITSDYLELRKDIGMIIRLGEKYDKMRRKLKILPSSTFSIAFPIKTNKNNNWLLFLSKATSVTKYKGTESINILELTYYFTDIGLRAFKIIPDSDGSGRTNGISVFNSHLFTRYAERLNLNISDPINGYFSSQKVQEIGMIGTCSEGMILGEIQNAGRWIVFKTFVTDQQMFPDQTDEERGLINWMHAEIEGELNKDQFNKPKYDYLADTLLGVKKASLSSLL